MQFSSVGQCNGQPKETSHLTCPWAKYLRLSKINCGVNSSEPQQSPNQSQSTPIAKQLSSALQKKFKQVSTTQDLLKLGASGNPNSSTFAYGGLIKPKRIQNVKVPNRNMLIASGDGDDNRNSPDKDTGRWKKGNHFKKRRGSSTEGTGRNTEDHTMVHTEMDEEAIKDQIWQGIQEEERLFKETLQAVQSKTLVEYVKQTINNPNRQGSGPRQVETQMLIQEDREQSPDLKNVKSLRRTSNLPSSRPLSAQVPKPNAPFQKKRAALLEKQSLQSTFQKFPGRGNINQESHSSFNVAVNSHSQSRFRETSQSKMSNQSSVMISNQKQEVGVRRSRLQSVGISTQASTHNLLKSQNTKLANQMAGQSSQKAFARPSNGGLIARAVKGAISHAMLKKFVDEDDLNASQQEQEPTPQPQAINKNNSKASIWTSMISPQHQVNLPAIGASFLPAAKAQMISINEESMRDPGQAEKKTEIQQSPVRLPRPTVGGSALSNLLAGLSHQIKGFNKIDPDSGDHSDEQSEQNYGEPSHHISKSTPRHEMLGKIQRLAYEAQQLCRDYCIGTNQDLGTAEKSLKGDLDGFSTAFKERFAKLKVQYRYKGEPKVMYCVMKCEGDILMDVRSIEAAIITYKELKNYCEEKKLFNEKMATYQQLGYCYRLVRYHAVAVDYFKKQLELAWELSNVQAEMHAYDNIALEYYYMNDIEKAKMYEERVSRGKLERKESIIRNVCVNILQSKREKMQLGLKKVSLKKNVLGKIDEERMPDYGHSKGYALLPNFCPETDPLQDKSLNAMSRQEKELIEAKQQAKREKESKVEFIMLKKQVSGGQVDHKNRDKYDIQLLAKSQEFIYKLFDESRFEDIVKRAKQRTALGDDIGKIKGGKRLIGHQSQLRALPPHIVKQIQQLKSIEEILLKLVVQSSKCLGL